jgi:hypothetical protein
MLGPAGEIITTSEYLEFFIKTRDLIHSIDPDVLVMMSGMTSLTETYYTELTRSLLGLVIHSYTSHLNFHYYTENISLSDKLDIDGIKGASRDLLWIVTECNHIDSTKSDLIKFNTLKEMWEVLCKYGKAPVAYCPFLWRADAFLPPGWTIQGTELEHYLRDM